MDSPRILVLIRREGLLVNHERVPIRTLHQRSEKK
jgi:hypothetical protein